MENAHTYKATVHAQVTIYQEIEVCLVAKNEQDFIKKAKEKFEEVMENHYGWADYDEANVDEVEDMGELPF